MASVFTIAPNPHWVIIDNFSRLPAGAVIYTYRQLEPSVFKPAYQDAGGTIPYPQPIEGRGNGTFDPIFWEFDPDNPTDTYYIQVWSDFKGQGVMLWDFQGLSGGGSGGGGGNVTFVQDIRNVVVNNIFFRNTGPLPIAPATSLSTFLTVAPSNNAGFVSGNSSVLSNGEAAPDITFQKNNTTATDALTFPTFTLGSTDLSPNITPEFYLHYVCSVAGSGETYKYVQIPLQRGVQTLGGQAVKIRIYARSTNGNSIIELFWKTFFGDGGGSGQTITPIGSSITLDGTWKEYLLSDNVPSVAAGTVGSCGNDALFLLIQFPLNAITTIDFIKPSVYLGINVPGLDYVSNDEVDAVVNSPRTGDIRFSVNSFLPGWVIMNDGTIANGSAVTPPAGNVFARNNPDTFALYDLIWRTFQSNTALAPRYNAAGVALVGYGSSAVADFTANNQLQLTKQAGRVIAGVGIPSANVVPITGGSNTGTNWTIGQMTGNELHTQQTNEVGIHNHPPGSGTVFVTAQGAFPAFQIGAGTGVRADSATTGNNAGGTAFNIQNPVTYQNIFIKL